MPELMIQTENLTKRFPCSTADVERECLPLEDSGPGDEALTWFTAVDRLNLEVPAGKIWLAGPNGDQAISLFHGRVWSENACRSRTAARAMKP